MKKVIFIFSRLLLGAIGGSIILGLAFYLPAKIRESKSESEWIKFPSPIEKAIKIVKTTGRSISELTIVLESVSGNLFGCKIDEVACFPYQTSEEPTFEGELVPCRFKPDSQEFSKYFPTQIIDTCGISLGEVGIIAVLLEDNTLWIPGHVQYLDWPGIYAVLGLILGGLVGAVIGLFWGIQNGSKRVQR